MHRREEIKEEVRQLKKRFKMKQSEDFAPGEMISRARSQRDKLKNVSSKTRTAIMGAA